MKDKDVVYFELNNWFSGEDYPSAEPFISWFKNDLKIAFMNEKWVKENKLCVLAFPYDMSVDFLVTATKDWVLKNCPDLLSDNTTESVHIIHSKEAPDGERIVKAYPYKRYLRFPETGECEIYSDKCNYKFLEYKKENIGITWEEDPCYED